MLGVFIYYFMFYYFEIRFFKELRFRFVVSKFIFLIFIYVQCWGYKNLQLCLNLYMCVWDLNLVIYVCVIKNFKYCIIFLGFLF